MLAVYYGICYADYAVIPKCVSVIPDRTL